MYLSIEFIFLLQKKKKKREMTNVKSTILIENLFINVAIIFSNYIKKMFDF